MNSFDIRQNPAYFEKDPKKKDLRWWQEMVSILRSGLTPIVERKRAEVGMKYLMGNQSMDNVMKSFIDGSSFKNDTEFEPFPFFESTRNILVSEFKKGAYMPMMVAEDAAAEMERKRDLKMLENRFLLENAMNQLGSRVSRPPYKLDKKNFSTNVEAFDEMGLDARSPQDLSFFRKVYQRLDHEEATTELVRALYRYNEFDLNSEELVNDILAKKAIAWQMFESAQTGELKWRYLLPETVSWIRGKRRDGKDAVALDVSLNISVREFLERAAGSFDFNNDQHRMMLLQAIRYSSQVDWYGLTYHGAVNEDGDVVCSWGEVQKYTVSMGYMEFKTINGVAQKRNKKNGIAYPIGYDEQVSVNSIYEKEVTEVQDTYKCYYISCGMYSQYLWDYGPLYHTVVEGQNDEYSNYSICVWVGTGKTAVEINKNLINAGNFALYKLLWGLYESKPNVEVFDVTSLTKMLDVIKPGSTAGNSSRYGGPALPAGASMGDLENLISFMKKSLIRIYASGDQKLGGSGRPHYVEQGGIDPLAVAMQSVMDWVDAKIKANLGINALREGYTPDPKDGYRLNVEAMKNSRNATYYIPDAITNCMKGLCERSILLAQDLIALGGKGKDFIVRLIGTSQVNTIISLEKVAAHRYGMFIEVQNSDQLREEVRQEAAMAWTKGDIQYHEYILIKDIREYRKASLTLAFFKERGERVKREEAELMHQREMAKLKMENDGKMQLEDLKGKYELAKTDSWGEWYMRAHQIPADAAIQKKQMDIAHESDRQSMKVEGRVKEIQAQANASIQAPLPAAPVIESDQSQGASQE